VRQGFTGGPQMLKILKNRYFLFGVICVIGFTILLGQLAYITVKMGDTYYTLSMERKSVELLLKGSRGNILDRNGIPMAMNKQIFVVELAGKEYHQRMKN